MQLPNKDAAYIPRAKLTDYLLSFSHPTGKTKAKFFRRHGFDESNIERLEQGLVTLLENPVAEESPSPYGTKYSVDGTLKTPKGTLVGLRTIWIIETTKAPRFVTAYPYEKKEVLQ